MTKEYWIEHNYNNIVQWAKNMTKSDELSYDLAHYAIEIFLTNQKVKGVIEREVLEPEVGHARGFMLAIMRNSWYGKKSEFSRYYKAHRADIGSRKRNLSQEDFDARVEAGAAQDYDYSQDFIVEAIEGILEEWEIDTRLMWFYAKIFRLWLETPNYSKLSRELNIPRTTISNAVEVAKQEIREELQRRNISPND